jgi:short-subunit dehydrogenase
VRLKDRIAVVTGAASGMGRALCPLMAREGARLGLLDRNEAGLASLEGELKAAGFTCTYAAADVTDCAAVRSAVETLAGRLGPVDLLVACAGITGATLLDEPAVEETERLARVNYLGVVHTIDAVLPGMLQRGAGQVVALSSLAGCRGMPFSAAYCASKAALTAYLESIRPPLRRRGVYVTTVLPGFVRTPLMETARVRLPVAMLEPEQAARHILRAILGRRRVYAFPWTTSLGVRLLCCLPAGLYDWLMARGAAKVSGVTY